MTVPDERLTEAVRAVVDPGLFHTLGDLGTVRSVRGRRRSTEVVVAVPAAGHPAPRELTDEIATAVLSAGGAGPEVELIAMNEAEEAELRARLRELGSAAGAAPEGAVDGPAHDHAGTITPTPRAGRRQATPGTAQRAPHPGSVPFPTRPPALGSSPSPPARGESASRP